jgi:hypothetical protein
VKFMLLIYGDERVWDAMSQADQQRVYAAHGAYAEAMAAAGVIRGGAELRPTRTARSVRFGGRRPQIVDGPFAETKEQLGGYYLIEVDSIEQALEWAERMPGMTEGTVEVRPLGEGLD